MKTIYSMKTIASVESKVAALTQFTVETIDKLHRGSRTLQVKLSNLCLSLIKMRMNVRKKYFRFLKGFAENQAQARHERLAYIALEKVKMEQEAETLKEAAVEISRRI
jgi:hypothetical protein